MDERVQALQRIITNYATENLELKSKVARVELENTDLRRDIANMRSDVAELQRGIAKVTRMVEKLVETN